VVPYNHQHTVGECNQGKDGGAADEKGTENLSPVDVAKAVPRKSKNWPWSRVWLGLQAVMRCATEH
jgi:hypothetical protein